MFFRRRKLILRVFAGLGNQQFQYAYAKILAIKFNRELVLDTSYFLKRYHPIKRQGYFYPYKLGYFDLNEKKTSWLSREIIGIINYRSIIQRLYKNIQSHPILRDFLPALHLQNEPIDEKLFSSNNDIVISGYFQISSFFYEFQENMGAWFMLKAISSSSNKGYLDMARQSNSVSIHIRRTDYTTNGFYKMPTLDYYRLALDFIKKSRGVSAVLVFSDDIQWVKQNLGFVSSPIFINNQGPDFEHQFIMSCCHHNIIANSTFSWWAAMMNRNIDKIVCSPKDWFNGVETNSIIFIPDAWKFID